MPAEVFFAPASDVGTLTPTQLEAELSIASLAVESTEEDGLRWVEFDGFESRLLIANVDEPLSLITLQFYGDLSHETPLIEKIEAVLVSHDYVNADQFSPDEERA
jgi:hypothetical protein